ncbi:hypothetical protein [Lysinibacillus capsici]|uniref:hypothetical protein n=1 Tax=Lysinibacillus capsici TaxID=2115968 RepID=UPI002A7F584A|nr:hypothetical protein [Lysinibacillus capsici]
MEKVQVSQDVAKVLDHLTMNYTKKVIIDTHVRNPNGWPMDENKALKGLDLDVLCQALYCGYTAEQTPEEKLLEYFSTYKNKILDGTATPIDELVALSIETTCVLLNAKIKGVNC